MKTLSEAAGVRSCSSWGSRVRGMVTDNTGRIIATAIQPILPHNNPLDHVVLKLIDAVSSVNRSGTALKRGGDESEWGSQPYLCRHLDLYLSHEPCVMCSMAVLHSRFARVYYQQALKEWGGLGSQYHLHADQRLNHRFDVFHCTAKQDRVHCVYRMANDTFSQLPVSGHLAARHQLTRYIRD
uniref:CMP/dCMP-type deaminase domain-containing protein n=1 Tax=Spongospora subterranea TaxID=70186 RepID=A0A0H5R8W5_9EUKA|eukprot:CRZ04809.1 hypothetical protein [Spongospora subterranea]